MPSPVAHSLAGLALIWLLRVPLVRSMASADARHRQRLWLGIVIFAAIAADLDFIPGFLVGEPGRFHRGPTHSLGAAVLFGVLTVFIARLAAVRSPRGLGLFLGTVFASHVVLDLLTLDFGDQIGLPLFWPLVSGNVVSPFHVFIYIRRGMDASGFLSSQLNSHNAYAVLWEFVVMGAVLLVVRLVGAGPAALWARGTAWMDRDA